MDRAFSLMCSKERQQSAILIRDLAWRPLESAAAHFYTKVASEG